MKYRLLGRSGLRVSEICLGTMGFGEEWGYGANKEESQKMFDLFLERGGNFIDTANRYTEGTSEKYLGDFISEKRNSLVLATKYSLYTQLGDSNDGGNHRKNMVHSVEGSLKRLNTNFIDVLFLHAWDFTTPVEEVMRSLDDLVRQGKVLYVAVSDTPAWIISRANLLAELRGWTPFIGLQMEYNLLARTPERDLIPMANELGLGILAWGPIAGGALSGKYLTQGEGAGRLKTGSKRLDERAEKITREVLSIASESGCSAVHVALNWLRQQQGNVIPVLGCRNAAQLADSLDCLQFSLTPEQMKKLTDLSAIELGFPHEFLASDPIKKVIFGGMEDKIEIKNNNRI